MTGPLTTRSTLLQALRDRPGYGSELIRRLERLTAGRAGVSEARVYPVLKQLEHAGLVKSSRVVPRGRRGARARTYYDLTAKGIARANLERSVLLALIFPQSSFRATERARERMARRLVEMEQLSEFGEQLRAAASARDR